MRVDVLCEESLVIARPTVICTPDAHQTTGPTAFRNKFNALSACIRLSPIVKSPCGAATFTAMSASCRLSTHFASVCSAIRCWLQTSFMWGRLETRSFQRPPAFASIWPAIPRSIQIKMAVRIFYWFVGNSVRIRDSLTRWTGSIFWFDSLRNIWPNKIKVSTLRKNTEFYSIELFYTSKVNSFCNAYVDLSVYSV